MKNLIVISALFSFLWIQFYNSAVFMAYEIDKAQIIEEFCVNKDKPHLQCDGKCHLSKQLIDEDKNAPSQETPIFISELNLYFWPSASELYYFNYSKRKFGIAPNSLYHFYQTNNIYHPPRA